jgi:Ala-tRNA(Pro) deacylase
LLTGEGVEFQVVTHRVAYTALERAAAAHITGGHVAKAVVVRDGDWFALAVLPATAQLDLARLRAVAGRPGLVLAQERDFSPLFPDAEVGAMPPFGRLYNVPVYLDRSLAEAPELVLEAGTHQEEVRMPAREYLRVERPAIADLAAARPAA